MVGKEPMMKQYMAYGFLGVFVVMTLAGCTNAQQLPSPTETSPVTPPPLVTVTFTATVEPTDLPTDQPASGPAVETGSTYPYVDGATLVAVPGGKVVMGGNGADNSQ